VEAAGSSETSITHQKTAVPVHVTKTGIAPFTEWLASTGSIIVETATGAHWTGTETWCRSGHYPDDKISCSRREWSQIPQPPPLTSSLHRQCYIDSSKTGVFEFLYPPPETCHLHPSVPPSTNGFSTLLSHSAAPFTHTGLPLCQ
jgi:hypothetical protein